MKFATTDGEVYVPSFYKAGIKLMSSSGSWPAWVVEQNSTTPTKTPS